jgi:hypothetical protein
MVTCNTYGRMGNFLFQAAAVMAYAWAHGLEFCMPRTSKVPGKYPVYLQHLAGDLDPKKDTIILEENGFPFQELPFKKEWKDVNIILDGYWQTEKYFKHHRRKLIEAFQLPWAKADGYVSVHVRRGDYLRLSKKHPVVAAHWYKQQMAKFPGYKFCFFSDDLDWCRKTFGIPRWIEFSTKRNEVDDLMAMSFCEHHICSASTFSWWGAWLNQNPNKRIIMPKQWLMPGWGGLDTRDVVPKDWERY